MEEQRTIGTIIHLSLEESDIIEELQRLDKEVYSREFRITKQAIIKKVIQFGIPALRKELMNEPDNR